MNSVETKNLQSTEGNGTGKGGAREGAGAKPLPLDAKMVAYKINALPRDWDYLQLFIPADVKPEERTPSHLFRACVERLRMHAPNGPDKPFYVPQPDQPRKVRRSSSVSRAAARRGLEVAEYINRACAAYEAQNEAQNNQQHKNQEREK